ncbi:toxin biosynthesis protein [Aspergillus japonicus CBS 114.51]|uniref:Toxin biosynthesis protein n=1 Tax=Aspergillus japonicus CBS 114.51 TaxID=1448312 RepID=A0A8T8WJ27_ASPJA|nr:toxin biosynthesis protein [Aspergillus japonicus CBS 114.51]RAH75781.1 toxin biosynthesis protein [Aspergillus japonicus CBS 114.51]
MPFVFPPLTPVKRVPASRGPEHILKAFKEDGVVVIEGFFSLEQVEELNDDLTPALEKVKNGPSLKDPEIARYHGSNTKRMSNMSTHSKIFRTQTLDNDLLHDICKAVFAKDSGDYWLNTALVIDIGPGNEAQPLHRDEEQHPVFRSVGPGGIEASINFFIALTRFTDENGATRMIPGSHQWPKDATRTDGLEIEAPHGTLPVEMNAGDVALFSGRNIHGGGANRTKDERRRGVAMSIQASYLTPEEAHTLLVPLDKVREMTPRAQRMLGFRSQFPKDTPGIWMSDMREIAEVIGLERDEDSKTDY